MPIVTLFIVAVVSLISLSAHAQNSDDDLRIYAIDVVNVPPFKRPFSGYGIYLGGSTIITAAHVVGHWPLFTDPTVIIGGRQVRGKVIKKGAFPQLDLAQLSIEQASLPEGVRLRRNILCNDPGQVGADVVIVYPDKTVRSQIISPRAIASQYRGRYSTLVSEPQGSGSGVF